MKALPRKKKDITRLIKPQVRKLAAYHIDEMPCRIKLDAMENPFSLPPLVQREIVKAVNSASINRYPDPSGKELKRSIADLWGMKPATMILGNGSDELIQAILLAFGGPTLIPVPTFAMYGITSQALSQRVATVPLDDNFDLDAGLLLKKAKESKAKVIFLACPNNPTGNRFSDRAVRKILDRADAAVVLDEAYFSFSGKSYLPLLSRYPNLIVLRTLSKIGFAGLRIGVLAASPEIVAELNKIRLPYNINTLSQVAAVAALKHTNIIERQISLLISERQNLYNALAQMRSVTAFPSDTNFILFRTVVDATAVYLKLKKAGILIKNLNKPGPLKNCLRVTIGAKEENKDFLKTLRNILDTD